MDLDVPTRAPGTLGLYVRDATDELLEQYGIPGTKALDVRYFYQKSPARDAGVELGDLIIEVQGKPVTDAATFTAAVKKMVPGEQLWLMCLRGDKRNLIEVMAEEQK